MLLLQLQDLGMELGILSLDGGSGKLQELSKDWSLRPKLLNEELVKVLRVLRVSHGP